MEIRIFGKYGSNAVKSIIANTSVKRYSGNNQNVDLMVNYGLAGNRLDAFYKKYKRAKEIPTLNLNIGHSKLRAVEDASRNGILVPESKTSLGIKDDVEDWIEKLVNSIGGKGIRKATRKIRQVGRYYQRMIKDRKYEIRVHAFSWIPMKEWKVQRRTGDHKTIAWNFSQGGHFSNVYNPMSYRIYSEAMETSSKILKMLGMSFGAVDFIVDNSGRTYFIEINSAPGFTELSQSIYTDAFGKLARMSAKDFFKGKK